MRIYYLICIEWPRESGYLAVYIYAVLFSLWAYLTGQIKFTWKKWRSLVTHTQHKEKPVNWYSMVCRSPRQQICIHTQHGHYVFNASFHHKRCRRFMLWLFRSFIAASPPTRQASAKLNREPFTWFDVTRFLFSEYFIIDDRPSTAWIWWKVAASVNRI